jgi:putative transposase
LFAAVQLTRRIAASLQIGRSCVQKVLRRENLRAIQPKSFKPQTTDSKHGLPVCANLLQNADNAPTGQGEVLVCVFR